MMKRLFFGLLACCVLMTGCAPSTGSGGAESTQTSATASAAQTAPAATASAPETAAPTEPSAEVTQETQPTETAAPSAPQASAAPETSETPDTTDTSASVEDPEDPQANMTSITYYLPNDNADGFTTETIRGQADSTAIVLMLVDLGALPEGCQAQSFSIVTEDTTWTATDGTATDITGDGKTAILDMSAAFGTALSSMGTAGETMYMGSLVNTFLDAFGLTQLIVTVDGQTIETGHMIYNMPLTFYA